MPQLTIAMPFYNDAAYIAEAVNSVCSQTFRDFSLLLVNDGSSDASLEIVEKFTDKRIRIIQHPSNLGRPQARNTALQVADSEYFAWMDSDDIALPNRFAIQIRFLEQHPEIDICGGKMIYFNERHGTSRLPKSPATISAACLFYPPIANATACFRLSSVKRTGVIYDGQQKRAQDYAFWGDLLLGHRLKAANLSAKLIRNRYFERSSSPIYHILAVKNHVFPYLGIEADSKLAEFHTGFVLADARQFVAQYGLKKCLGWLDNFWFAIQRQQFSAEIEQSMRIELRNRAERLLAVSCDKHALGVWQKTNLARYWSPLLVQARVALRKIRNFALGR